MIVRTGFVLGRITVALYAALIILPVVWIASTAFKRQIDILMARVTFKPTLANIEKLLFTGSPGFSSNFWNSAIVAIAATALVMLICALAAYALSAARLLRWLGPGLLGVCLLFSMIPPITFVGSWFSLFRDVGLNNTLTGLVIANVAMQLPLALWLSTTFAREVPGELLDAAEIDGCSASQRFRFVFLPLAKNGLTATAILVFLFIWNDFTIALTLSAQETRTIPVAITGFAQLEQVRYAEMAASSLLASLPALILLVIGQRFIVKGLLVGALK
jgi:multiple sugar transport system permease protein